MRRVLWIADKPDWAYDAIVQAQMAALPQYDHQVWYYMSSYNIPAQVFLLQCLARECDVIVAMYIRYLELLEPKHMKKTAIMLTGMRPFE